MGGELRMTCKLLQVDIIWWAMVYDIQNSKLRTGLQSGWLTLTTPDPLRLATGSGRLFS